MDDEKMIDSPQISVIIPVYNVAPYLKRCVDSVLGQSYKNIEVILVDDGSTDETGGICDSCVQEDSRVRVVHLPENCGVSHARNVGMKMVSSEYLTFVDGDDYIEPSMLELLLKSMLENDADISICDRKKIGFKNSDDLTNMDNACVLSGKEAVYYMINGKNFYWGIGAKLYRYVLAEKCSFDETIQYGEDTLFMYQQLRQASKVSYIPDELYGYVYREGSAVNSGINRQKIFGFNYVYKYMYEDVCKRYPDIANVCRNKMLKGNTWIAIKAVGDGEIRGSQLRGSLRELQKTVRKYFSITAFTQFRYKRDCVPLILLYINVEIFWAAAFCYKKLEKIFRK